MGFSSSLSLILLTLVIIISFGAYMNLVTISVRLNDPKRINLITKHIREDLDYYKVNNTQNINSSYIYVENMWADDTYITDLLIVDTNGSIVKEIPLSEYIIVPSMKSFNITRDVINNAA